MRYLFFFLAMLLVLGLTIVACDEDDDEEELDPSDIQWSEPTGLEVVHADAVAYCDSLIWDGENDWHLPTISELRTLLVGCNGTTYGEGCMVTEECSHPGCYSEQCEPCETYEGPGIDSCYWELGDTEGLACGSYWSKTRVTHEDEEATENEPEEEEYWIVNFRNGGVFCMDELETAERMVICVR